jgi:hypothetical protein
MEAHHHVEFTGAELAASVEKADSALERRPRDGG